MKTTWGNGARGLAALLGAVLSLVLPAGCGGASAPAASDVQPARAIRVAVLKGPTGVGMVNLMQAAADGEAVNDYDFMVLSSPEEVAAKLSSGEIDLAAAPTNLAAVLHAKTSGGVRMLAANTLGVLYVLQAGGTIRSVADLRGHTIHATGQGANPEYVLRFLLERNGLNPDTDVTLTFVSENDELATLLATGKATVAMVPEPVVTAVVTKKPSLRVALDLTAEWDRVNDESRLIMGALIGRTEFVAEHSEAVQAFLAEYQASIGKATGDIAGTAALCEQHGIIASAAVAEQAIPRLNLIYLDGSAMADAVQGYFQVLHDANPKSIGGALPPASFYYAG
ncbi:MAG: ABC transporter substrate-binding protein [Propionibacteriaceae bacterium]|nr:ABC transporter substrate-binding protein [Propionibacteriaceae bacterium]